VGEDVSRSPKRAANLATILGDDVCVLHNDEYRTNLATVVSASTESIGVGNVDEIWKEMER
jgi:hypothetical protein